MGAVLCCAANLFAGPRYCPPGPACAAPVCAPAPTYKTVERTIYVPSVTYETRVVPYTACRPEIRERTVMVPKMIPESRQVERHYTVMKPVYSTNTVSYTVNKPVTTYVDQTYCVQIPYRETRQETRTVCRQVPYTDVSYVCEDQGHWEDRVVPVSCGKGGRRGCASNCASCASCAPCTQKVWVSNIVKKPVEVTCYRTEVSEVPYTHTVTLYRSETRSRKVPVTNYIPETKTRPVTCTNFVPEVKSKLVTETSYRCEMVPQVQRYTEMVPYTAERTISVPVCTMVPKVITCQVPCCN